MGLLSVVFMSLLLGLASFGIGNLPLFFTFSKSRIVQLSAIGTGLLLGAALGVVIPEGIETATKDSGAGEVPTTKIAVCLLGGFSFMMIVEQFLSGHSHSHSHERGAPPIDESRQRLSYADHAEAHSESTLNGSGVPKPADVDEFDVQLDELDRGVTDHDVWTEDNSEERRANAKSKAYPLTLGLVVHSLADGLALGASSLPLSSGSAEASSSGAGLSIIVFLALMIHKAPTALALSMSLLSSSLPRLECRRHIAIFSLSTPLGAIGSYGILSVVGTSTGGSWTGLALLISGGTFLYVATVLQPLSHSEDSQQGVSLPSTNMNEKTRAALVIAGMFVPLLIGVIVGHDH